MLYLWALTDGCWKWASDADTASEHTPTWHHATSVQQLMESMGQAGQKALIYFPTGQAQIFSKSLSKQQYKQLGNEGATLIIEEFSLNGLEELSVKTWFDASAQMLYLIAISNELRLQYQQLSQLLAVDIVGLLPDMMLLNNGVGDVLYSDESVSILKRGTYLGFDAGAFHLLNHKLITPITELTLWGLAAQQQVSLQQMYPAISCITNTNGVPQGQSSHQFHVYNLLAGSQSSSVPLYWKMIAATAILAVVACIVYQSIVLYQNTRLTVALRTQNESYFRQLFPDEPIISGMDLGRRITDHLPTGSTGTIQTMQVLGAIAPVLATHRAYVQELKAQGAVVQMAVLADDIAQLEKINSDLQHNGFRSQMSSNQATDGKKMQAQFTLEYQN